MVSTQFSFRLFIRPFSTYSFAQKQRIRQQQIANIKEAHARTCEKIEESKRPLFDEWFLLNLADLQAERFQNNDQFPSPRMLANAWVKQLGPTAKSPKAKIDQILPTCERFLAELTAVCQGTAA